MVQHDDPVDDLHQGGHDVLDPDDRDLHLDANPPQQLGRRVHLSRIEPAEALVGEQQRGPGGERARDLELLESGGAEHAGGRAGFRGEADQGQHLAGAGAGILRGAAHAVAEVGRDRDVVEDR